MVKSIKVSLHFEAADTDKPIAYCLAKDYDLQFSILQADIRPGSGGRMIMDLSGEEENLEKGLEFVRSKNIKASILSKAVVWNDEKCVHCGACLWNCTRGRLDDPERGNIDFRAGSGGLHSAEN